MRIIFFLILLGSSLLAQAQKSVSTLFLGNSYTHRNNTPQLVKQFASSQYHNFVFETYAPGGYTLNDHSRDSEAIKQIKKKAWQYVVLQEQSQLPSFPSSDVENYVYPAVMRLDSIISENSSCSRPAFFRTWGRKNGDSRNCAVWPPVCTYSGMDSLLKLRYQKMADTTSGVMVPVGDVWKKIRQTYPSIELYKPDESHPSAAGSYLAACCFYSAFFREDPTQSSYTYTLNDSTANRIKRQVKWMVFNKLENWGIGVYEPLASYEIVEQSKGKLILASRSINANEVKWFVNDSTVNGDTLELNVVRSGRYKFQIMAKNDCSVDTVTFWLKLEGDAVSINGQEQLELVSTVSNGQLIINTNQLSSQISIFDLTGKIISGFSNTNRVVIATSTLPMCFIVEVRNEGSLVKRQLLVL